MFSVLDSKLFPDSHYPRALEIIQLERNKNPVYLIFKNGNTSIRKTKNIKLISENHFNELTDIDIFIRNPYDRYVSGVQRYVESFNKSYDKETILKIIDDSLFLNRHFSLQFHWLVNLRRYTNANLHIRPMAELNDIVDTHENISTRDEYINQYFINNQTLMYYLTLDEVLFNDFMGTSVRFNEIVQFIKVNFNEQYNDILMYSKEITNVLP